MERPPPPKQSWGLGLRLGNHLAGGVGRSQSCSVQSRPARRSFHLRSSCGFDPPAGERYVIINREGQFNSHLHEAVKKVSLALVASLLIFSLLPARVVAAAGELPLHGQLGSSLLGVLETRRSSRPWSRAGWRSSAWGSLACLLHRRLARVASHRELFLWHRLQIALVGSLKSGFCGNCNAFISQTWERPLMRSSSAAARNICKSSWFTFTSPWYMKFRIATMSGNRILDVKVSIEDENKEQLATHPLRKIMG